MKLFIFTDIVSSSDQEDVDIVKKSEENPIKKEEKIAEIENEKETTKNLVLLPLKQDKVLPSGDIPKGKIRFLFEFRSDDKIISLSRNNE